MFGFICQGAVLVPYLRHSRVTEWQVPGLLAEAARPWALPLGRLPGSQPLLRQNGGRGARVPELAEAQGQLQEFFAGWFFPQTCFDNWINSGR